MFVCELSDVRQVLFPCFWIDIKKCLPGHIGHQSSALLGREELNSRAYNKTNKTKLTNTKLSERYNTLKSIGEIINSMPIDKYYEKSN